MRAALLKVRTAFRELWLIHEWRSAILLRDFLESQHFPGTPRSEACIKAHEREKELRQQLGMAA